MKLEATSSQSPPTGVIALTNQFSELSDALLDQGVHPFLVAEAALCAFLPLALEVTRSPTIEAALLTLAARFNGNELRPVN